MVQENPDENLLVAVGDALPILARALGPDAYAPIFAQHHASALLKWTRGSQPDAVRAAGVGEPPLLPGHPLDFLLSGGMFSDSMPGANARVHAFCSGRRTCAIDALHW